MKSRLDHVTSEYLGDGRNGKKRGSATMCQHNTKASRAAAAAVLLVLLLAPPASLEGQEPKLTAAELVAKHLAAMGPAELRSAAKSRIAEGPVQMRILLGGSATAWGQAGLVSEGRKALVSLRFTHPDYAGEHMVFDGETFHISRANPVSRSGFGEFVYRYNHILREGLVGGVLSTAWPLLDVDGKRPRLQYEGLKRMDGEPLHKLTYSARKGSGDVKIDLYFEPETFRHVRSVYVLIIHARLGRTALESVREQETRLTLEERFSDFHVVDGLTLPTHWKDSIYGRTQFDNAVGVGCRV